MGSYAVDDFTESLHGTGIEKKTIEHVIAAWGNVDTDGACCEGCGGEWTGGFLLKLKNGQFAYVTGWCDYTGWGCQDGTDVSHFETEPTLETLYADYNEPPPASWDLSPSDLNHELEKPDDEIHV